MNKTLFVVGMVLIVLLVSAGGAGAIPSRGFETPTRKAPQAYENIIDVEEFTSELRSGRPTEIGGINFEAPHVPDEILVKFRGSDKPFNKIKVLPGTVREKIREYLEREDVEYAEPNYYAYALMEPNDQYYSYQWHLDNPEYGGINMENAWDISIGSGVIVAIVDTGIAYENYSERKGRRTYRYYQAPDLAQTSFVPGYDFVNDDDHPNDDHSHGTHVAGTVAQSTNNNTGVAGVAFNASLMPVKVLNKYGSGTYANVANGIRFAVDHGAHVINLSLGGSTHSDTLKDAVAYAYNNGVVVVAAAGNDSSNVLSYPAAYDEYVIAVGATRYDETLAYYSNYGPSLDLVAPGGDLNVDQNEDGYGDGVLQNTFNPKTKNTKDFGYWFFQGTSMAAPHVSGVAALLIAHGNATTPDEIRSALQETAEDLGEPGWDDIYGYGLVDAYAALNWTAQPPVPEHDVAITNIAAPSSAIKGESVSVGVTAANLGDFEENFTVTLTDCTDDVEIGSRAITLEAGASTTLTFSWDTAAATIGDHILEAVASTVPGETDLNNNSKTVTVTVREPAHDVAVTALDVPSQVVLGDVVTVEVSVANLGDFEESFTVSLTDTTDSNEIGTQAVTLDAGGSETLSFSWVTTGASLGDHLLEARASVVEGETETANNVKTATVSVIKAKALSVTVSTDKDTYKRYNTVYITVVVTDGTDPVEGATVDVTVTRPDGAVAAYSGATDSEGVAKFSYKPGWRAPKGEYIVYAEASKSGYTTGSGSTTFIVN